MRKAINNNQQSTTFITGATGFIGQQLTKRLAAKGETVHTLYRNGNKIGDLKNWQNVHLFQGDILHLDGLRKAMSGCQAVFHLAGYARPWHKDPQTFFRINVEGTKNVLKTAKEAGVKRVVFTSTAGVVSPSNGFPSDENTPRSLPFSTLYEQSKSEAEKLAFSFNDENTEVVVVNPSRVYGPGLLSESNGVTKMIKLYLGGKFRLLPGDGTSIGNYVFIEDVVKGHLLAMQKGRAGERYILGGENASFIDFFEILKQVSNENYRMFKMPITLMLMTASLMEKWANLTGQAPLITPPWVQKYLYNWDLSVVKAERELGYQPTSLEEGIQKTIQWLLSKSKVDNI